MILPIVAFGHPNLRKVSVEITREYPGLEQFIADMWETMYYSVGVGLAAPQVNRQIRLFVIDATPYEKQYPEAAGFKKVFINAKIVEQRGEEWLYNEGCLSIPDIHEDVSRPAEVHLTWYDENFEFHDEWISGINARVIQHEYDHLEGILFVDKIHSLRRIMLKRKLTDISKGDLEVAYRMILPPRKR
ncbi:MAG: peptide deformylase [Bacteroidales bacterium]|nr:peptide deformylase [Bacteroidales bacterium]